MQSFVIFLRLALSIRNKDVVVLASTRQISRMLSNHPSKHPPIDRCLFSDQIHQEAETTTTISFDTTTLNLILITIKISTHRSNISLKSYDDHTTPTVMYGEMNIGSKYCKTYLVDYRMIPELPRCITSTSNDVCVVDDLSPLQPTLSQLMAKFN